MGIWDGFREWRKDRYEKKIETMRLQGKCPECQGTGLTNFYGVMEPIYTDQLDCESCNGTGMFADWALVNGREDLH
ncbi:MAG TPA: methionine aminopeptidase [Bacillota bacterium]|nr:methionine aminopeptidase [Bacillota bacterium]